MKVSVSLPEADVAFIDDLAVRTGERSRSAVMHRAIRLLRTVELEESYAQAQQEWDASEDAQLWETTAADGLGDAPR